jgi:predicted Rossmann fold nucleotide-binding protein DprA/Smf involved in DNA uptake
MPFDITVIGPKNRDYPSPLRNKKARALFPRIWALGNLEVLRRPLLGFFCSVKCPGELILRSYDLARSLRDTGTSVIGGFHSPIEKDCLELLLKGTQPIILCPARSIENMLIMKEYRQSLNNGRMLFLSPFDKRERRPTVKTSNCRNLFVAALSAVIFVAHAGPASKTEAFCREIFRWQKPVYTFDSDYNINLIEMGALPVKPENVSDWANLFEAYNE